MKTSVSADENSPWSLHLSVYSCWCVSFRHLSRKVWVSICGLICISLKLNKLSSVHILSAIYISLLWRYCSSLCLVFCQSLCLFPGWSLSSWLSVYSENMFFVSQSFSSLCIVQCHFHNAVFWKGHFSFLCSKFIAIFFKRFCFFEWTHVCLYFYCFFKLCVSCKTVPQRMSALNPCNCECYCIWKKAVFRCD